MKVSKSALSLIKWTFIISVVAFVAVMFFFLSNLLHLTIGVLIGLVAVVARTIHLDLFLERLENINRDEATIDEEVSAKKKSMVAGVFFRQLLLLAALFISTYFFGLAGLVGTFIGFLSLRVAAFFVNKTSCTKGIKP